MLLADEALEAEAVSEQQQPAASRPPISELQAKLDASTASYLEGDGITLE